MDADGVPSSFTYQWVRVDADGMSNPADITDADCRHLHLTAADAGKKVKVKVSFTDELSGEEERTSAAYPSSGTVTTAANTTAPALTSVTVTSTPRKTTDTYGAREHIEFSMTFDAPVTVTGDPTFAFDLGGPSTATWYAGSGTTTLRFSHAVSGGSSGDRDTNGISWAATAIALNGGTIAGRDNAVAAVLTHVAQSNLAGHKVDGRTTAVTPATVTDVVVTSTPMLMASGSSTADTYGFGETIVITVTVSEAVEVEGDPEFEFSLTNPGGAANNPQATYDRTRSIATTIVFTYTVQAGDMDNNGIWIGTHSQTFMLDANDRIRTARSRSTSTAAIPRRARRAATRWTAPWGRRPYRRIPRRRPWCRPPPRRSPSSGRTRVTAARAHSQLHRVPVEGTTDWTNWYRGETPTQVTRTVITNLEAETAYDVRVHATMRLETARGSSRRRHSARWAACRPTPRRRARPRLPAPRRSGRCWPLTSRHRGRGRPDQCQLQLPVGAGGCGRHLEPGGHHRRDRRDLHRGLRRPGKTLKVRVTFDDDGGNTETLTSAATAAVTPAAGAPGSPTIVSATVGVGQVVLVWRRPDSRAGWSHYEYRSSAGDMIAPDAMWQQVQTGAGTPNQSYYQVVKGLTGGTTHTFQVRAVNTQGGSAPATVTATPVSQPSCTHRRVRRPAPALAGPTDSRDTPNLHRWKYMDRVWGGRARDWNPDT